MNASFALTVFWAYVAAFAIAFTFVFIFPQLTLLLLFLGLAGLGLVIVLARALQWMEREVPDVVLVDIGAPEVDGYAVTRHLRQSPRLRQIPVLLLAGVFEPVDDLQARESGADGVLVKPFEPEQLVSRVRSLLEHGTSRAVSIRTDGEPRYEFNEAAQRRRLTFDDATRAALDEADLVVVSCYPFDDDEQVALLLEATRDPEHRLIVDGNPRSGMLHDRDRFLANFERVAARSLLVKVG